MVEIFVFTLNAIVIYLVSDWLVRMIERRRATPFKNRQMVFFFIILALALVTFRILQTLLAG